MWVLRHDAPAVLGDELARRAVDEDQRGDACDLEHLAQRRLEVAQSIRHRQPRHFAEVGGKLLLAPVRGHEDDLERLAITLDLAVRFGKLWCEASAWRAPVRAEVQS